MIEQRGDGQSHVCVSCERTTANVAKAAVSGGSAAAVGSAAFYAAVDERRALMWWHG